MKTKILLIFTFIFSTFVFSQEVLSPNDEDNYNGVATEEMRDVYKKNKHQTKKLKNMHILDKQMLCGQEKFGERLILDKKLIIHFIIL